MRRRLAAPAALAVLTLGLAACAGDDGTGPVTEAPPTLIDNDDASDGGGGSDGGGSEASDGGGSTEAAPDIPAPDPDDYPGMDEETPEGAEQFTRYFASAMFWGYQTGSSSLLKEISGESCDACAETINEIDSANSEEKRWSEVQLEDAVLEEGEGEEFDHTIGYGVVVSEHSEYDNDSGERIEVPRSRYSFGLGVDWRDGEWVASALYVEAFVED